MMGIKRYSAGVMLALAACATTTSTPSIYYKTQAEADVALAAFDTDNPDCQLWTNWQKMCSRTGENGATYCNTDPVEPVKPSAPFCEVRTLTEVDGQTMLYIGDPAIKRLSSLSRNRFCEQVIGESSLSNEVLDLENQIEKSVTCSRFRNSRPFNGLDEKSQTSPLCISWKKTPNGLNYCDKNVPKSFCKRLGSLVRFPRYKNGLGSGGSTTYDSAIFGIYCDNR
jgi:hypothetical protein